MQIIKTTDGRHLGINIEHIPEIGGVLILGDYHFVVQNKCTLENGNIRVSNPNYQLELEE